jgi:hypothetical protein
MNPMQSIDEIAFTAYRWQQALSRWLFCGALQYARLLHLAHGGHAALTNIFAGSHSTECSRPACGKTDSNTNSQKKYDYKSY